MSGCILSHTSILTMSSNILITGESFRIIYEVAFQLNLRGYTPVIYNRLGMNFLPDKNYVLIGGPKNVSEYKKLCGAGFSPDCVFNISSGATSGPDEILVECYEGIISSYISTDTRELATWIYNSVIESREHMTE